MLAFSLLRAGQAVEARLESELGPVGLSAARYGVLDRLVRAGAPVALGELAAQLSCVRSNMTQLVDRLEADGLVRRLPDPQDRRTVRAEITRAGRERRRLGAERLLKVETWLEEAIPAGDREVLARLAEQLG